VNEDGKPFGNVNWAVTKYNYVHRLLPALQDMTKRYPRIFPRGVRDVIIIMDGATWHKKALGYGGMAAAMGLTDKNFLFHPASSPDLNLPAERCHSVLERATAVVVRPDQTLSTAPQIREVMERVWTKGGPGGGPLMTADAVKGLFAEMMDVCQEIVTAKGGHSMKQH
jgi:hypothetical protein